MRHKCLRQVEEENKFRLFKNKNVSECKSRNKIETKRRFVWFQFEIPEFLFQKFSNIKMHFFFAVGILTKETC